MKVIISKDFKTCLKHRMIAEQNHLLRMDIDPETDSENFQQNIASERTFLLKCF